MTITNPFPLVPDTVGKTSVITVPEGLAYAAKQSGRSTFDVGKEFWKLSKGQGKITISEYCSYRLFDSEKYSADDKSRFISDGLHWTIAGDCGDTSWFAVAEDKWISAAIVARDNLNSPETLAVIDKSERTYGGDITIRNADQLRSFLTSQSTLPVFGKMMRGLGSYGSFLITGADETEILFKTNATMPYQTFFDEVVKDGTFLLQKVIENHDFIKKYTPNTATIRMQNTVADEGIVTPFALIKIPSESNIADNYWRSGNIVCNLDLDTGEILTAYSGKDFDVQEHTHHPETGAPLIGEVLPFWSEIRDINKRCISLFYPIRYQSLDIAITPTGPLIVENNFGGSMHLPQMASRQGFMTDANRDFFRSCGCKLF